MNWFRFKVELVTWASKTALCVLSTLVLLRVLVADGSYLYPMHMRWLAENDWAIRVLFIAAIGVSWLCYGKAAAIIRSDKRYGER